MKSMGPFYVVLLGATAAALMVQFFRGGGR